MPPVLVSAASVPVRPAIRRRTPTLRSLAGKPTPAPTPPADTAPIAAAFQSSV